MNVKLAVVLLHVNIAFFQSTIVSLFRFTPPLRLMFHFGTVVLCDVMPYTCFEDTIFEFPVIHSYMEVAILFFSDNTQ